MHGVLANGNTFRTNTIQKSGAWPEVDLNATPENAIQLGKSLPDALKLYQPAVVTQIDGVNISGTTAPGYACPNCIIEVFLDDNDATVEALQSLAVVTADGMGNWSATLPFELSATQGLRTTNTTTVYNTIALMNDGTTTGLSDLYQAVQPSQIVYLPLSMNH